MLHIISQFLKKQNPVHLILRIGSLYAGVLAVFVILLIRSGIQPTVAYDRTVEGLLVAAITAVLQTLIGAMFLKQMKKTDSN